MNEIIERVKNLIISPKSEWEKISQESLETARLIQFLIMLALIPTVATFIGYALFGYRVPFVGYVGGSVAWALRYALVSFVSNVAGAFLAAFVINMLAPSFGSRQDWNKAFALVVYSYVPFYVAGVLYIIPSLGILASLAGLYGLYLLYLGLPLMMETTEDKHTTYFVVSLVVMIAAGFVLSLILTPLFIGRLY